jgi:hypothetical protein
LLLGRSQAVEVAQEQVDKDTPISRTPTIALGLGGLGPTCQYI